MNEEARFTEAEVNAILARAVDLERTASPNPGVRGGLSLTELREVASGAGIAPSLIDAAAADLRARTLSRPSRWLGAPPEARATRLVDVVLSSEDVASLVRLVESRSKRRGFVSEALGRVTWMSQSAQLTT